MPPPPSPPPAAAAAPTKQIRPKVRSHNKTVIKPAAAEQTTEEDRQHREEKSLAIASLDQDAEVEETRQRMENWMGLTNSNDKHNAPCRNQSAGGIPHKDEGHTHDTSSSSSSSTPTASQPRPPQDDGTSVVAETSKSQAKSILRTPKYSKQDAPVTATSSPPSSQTTKDSFKSEEEQDASQKAICKNTVFERDPTQPMLKRKVKLRPQPNEPSHHSAVEGYVPSAASYVFPPAAPAASPDAASMAQAESQTISKKQKPACEEENNNDDTSPLVLNSLEELFEAAGKGLPPQHDANKITDDTKLLEADIAFSVMTQDQYDSKLSELKEQHEEERQAQLRIFLGTEKIFEDENGSHDGGSSDEDDAENDLLEMFMGGDEDNADEYFYDADDPNDMDMERQPRAFRLLWETLSEWITPEAVQYIVHLTETAAAAAVDSSTTKSLSNWTPPMIERSDVEASRCAGLMAMVKLYLPKSLEELGFPSEIRRTADVRLGEFLRTFNYVQEAPKLPVKLWKAMTCILLGIVLVEHSAEDDAKTPKQKALPRSVATTEMTMDEYRYLTHSLIKTFGLP